MIIMLYMNEIPEEEKEIPSYLLVNLITWLRNKGLSESEILDCIKYICDSKKGDKDHEY